MDMSAITQLLAMQSSQTRQLAQIAIVKKSHEMDMALADMVDRAVRSAPAPAGQGLVVDRTA